jgi:hypothetical protein
MSVRRIRHRSKWWYLARVAFGRRRLSKLCLTREAARDAAEVVKSDETVGIGNL